MQINKTKKWFYLLTFIWVLMLLSLGSWWLYLVFKLHHNLSALNLPQLGEQSRFLNMMKWEGTFFFLFLILLGLSLFIMYLRDMKKSKSIQVFFASLTHELKTPLASMRLQAEVIKDLIEDESHSHEQLSNLTHRLIEDTYKLESELEKSLQISRIEQNASLNLMPISLERFLKRQIQRMKIDHKVSLSISADADEIMGDELSLAVIFRNLFENTKRHHPDAQEVQIKVWKKNKHIILIYDDFGKKFIGDDSKLGDLFYKFKSSKGSGIGLYIIKNLMKKMGGYFEILNKDRLKFKFVFQPSHENEKG